MTIPDLLAVSGMLRRARVTWWNEWPHEGLRSWLRGLSQLRLAARCGAVKPCTDSLPLPQGARILLMRLTHLGDILHAVPFSQAIKRQRPDVRLEILVGPWGAALARRAGCFDEVLVHVPDFELFHRGNRSGILTQAGELEFFRMLRSRNYHAIVATSPTHLAEQVIMCAVSPQLAIGASGGLPDYPVARDDRRRKFDSRMREADWVSSFLQDIGLAVEPAELQFALTDAERQRSGQLLAKLPQPRVVIAPGAGWPGKCWSVERFAQLADLLAESHGVRAVIIGSKDETQLASGMVSLMRHAPLNLTGETSFGESAAVIAASQLFIGNDSAPLHLAAALGTPALAIFGPTCASKWAPPGVRNRVLQREGLCDGCIYWHCRATCVHDGRCMKAISVDEAFREAAGMIVDFQ